MFCDNIVLIKKFVIGFEDSDYNLILYFLVILDFFDEFVVNFMKIFFGVKMFIKFKNIDKIIFLMLVVEQVLLRIEVIKILMDVFLKLNLYNQDKIGLIVFYYCFGLNNDDKICLGYLDIIFKDFKVIECLSKNDLNGDIVLSIVVKCLKYSRICSILKFFESIGNLKIIDIVNDEGYLFLYFFVKFLKEIEVLVEFECCVRVIIFILYDVNLDFKLDVEKKVV